MLIQAKLLATLLLSVSMWSLNIEMPPQEMKVSEVAYIEQSQEQKIISRSRSQEYLGVFELTAYTAGIESTGKRPGDKGYGITKSGAVVTEFITIAVDPRVIPLGSTVYIEGIGYRIAQDTGRLIKGKVIDIYIPDLKEAKRFGRQKLKVYIVN